MKNTILFIFILVLVAIFIIMKIEKKYETKDHWEDQTVFQINREEPRASFFPFESDELAIKNDKSLSSYYHSLNGEWKFHFAKDPSQKAIGFEKVDHDISNWENIQVPGHWEMQGWSVPIYLDEEYPFPPNPPFVPHDYNTVGSYVKTFELNKLWYNQDIFIHFGGVRSAFYLWLNGEFVGYSQGSKTPAEFDITDHSFIIRLEELLLETSQNPSDHCVIIDLGCGPGNITERLVTQWPNATVIGVDGSQPMLDIARQSQFKLPKKLQNIDYRRLFLSLEEVTTSSLKAWGDIVVCNSLLHHFPDPAQFWKVIKAISSQDAFVFIRDLRRPLREEDALLLQKKYLPNCHQILKNDYLASLRASFTVEEVQEQLLVEGFTRLKVIDVDDRYLEVFGVL